MCKLLLIFVATVLCAQNFVLAESESTCKSTCRGTTKSERMEIVDYHNKLRTLVAQGKQGNQPKASDMQKMSWDKELSRAAKKIAKTCKFEHVTVNDGRFSFVGQNLYMFSTTASKPVANWTMAIDSWYDENKVYTYPSNSDDKTGHYTQVVWATSNKVGCSAICYPDSADSQWTNILYVCNYGPGGNIIGEAPYKTGPGCEDLC